MIKTRNNNNLNKSRQKGKSYLGASGCCDHVPGGGCCDHVPGGGGRGAGVVTMSKLGVGVVTMSQVGGGGRVL